MIKQLNLTGLVGYLVRTRRYPALVFLFSRVGTEDAAEVVTSRLKLLREEDAAVVAGEVARAPEAVRKLHPGLCQCLPRGVGYHHAGLAPSAKRLVEGLFVRGLVPVLFCTETFALGVNFPARAVVLGSSTKREDGGYRPLLAREVLQMAGRAGRRGTDRRGFVYVAVDPGWPEETIKAAPADPEPLAPKLFLTPVAVLRLHARFGSSPEKARRYLETGFAAFRARRRVAELRALEECRREELRRLLEETGCCLPDPPRLVRDMVAGGACAQELTIKLSYAAKDLEERRSALMVAEKELERARKERPRARLKRKVKEKRRAFEEAAEQVGRLANFSPHPCGLVGDVERLGRCPVAKKVREAALALERVRESLAAADVATRLWGDYCALLDVLNEAGFADPDGVTSKGRLGVAVGDPAGLLFAEFLSRGVPEEPAWLAGVAAGCLYEQEDGKEAGCGPLPEPVRFAFEFLCELFEDAPLGWGVRYSPRWHDVVARWAQGTDIEKIAKEMPPGDFVVLARRAAEVLRSAAGAWPPYERQLLKAYRAVWRGEVAEVL